MPKTYNLTIEVTESTRPDAQGKLTFLASLDRPGAPYLLHHATECNDERTGLTLSLEYFAALLQGKTGMHVDLQ